MECSLTTPIEFGWVLSHIAHSHKFFRKTVTDYNYRHSIRREELRLDSLERSLFETTRKLFIQYFIKTEYVYKAGARKCGRIISCRHSFHGSRPSQSAVSPRNQSEIFWKPARLTQVRDNLLKYRFGVAFDSQSK